jgi:hypothetical protein
MLEADETVLPADWEPAPPPSFPGPPRIPMSAPARAATGSGVVTLNVTGSGPAYEWMAAGIRTKKVQLQVDGVPVRVA